jgi:hypothetical protein
MSLQDTLRIYKNKRIDIVTTAVSKNGISMILKNKLCKRCDNEGIFLEDDRQPFIPIQAIVCILLSKQENGSAETE